MNFMYIILFYLLVHLLLNSGYKIVLSAYPAQQNVANASIGIYMTRMVRWLRLRLNMLPIVAALFEPMIECVNLGFLIALSLKYFFGVPVLTTVAIHISIWMLLDYFLLRCVQVKSLEKFIFGLSCLW